MKQLIIPAYRIIYNHFLRNLILFLIFWLAVLGLTLFIVLTKDFTAYEGTGFFVTVLILNIVGLVMFVNKQLRKVEHSVDCRIADEGLTLTSTEEEKQEEIFIPYTELFDVKRIKNPFEDGMFYLRIVRKKVKEELFVYSNEMSDYDFNEAEKFILDKIKSPEDKTPEQP